MIKDIYFLARAYKKLDDSKYELLVNKQSINNLPPTSLNDDGDIRVVDTDVELPLDKLLYVYKAKLNTDTKEVRVKNVTIIDNVLKVIDTKPINAADSLKASISSAVEALIVDVDTYPHKIPKQ